MSALRIKSFTVNPLEVNCYVVSDETNEAVLIDPGCFADSEWDDVARYIRDNGLALKHCLLTHAHFDHIMGCNYAEQDFGVRPELHTDDVSLYNTLDQQALQFFGIRLKTKPTPIIGRCLNEGNNIDFGQHTLKVLHTPGHSPGGVCYLCEAEEVVFTGDTLFCGSMGRTDLTGGDAQQIGDSLVRLAALPENTVVYPGHGPATTIANERRWIQAIYSK
ncbi:MAG: MBL fold metallo-hydrolase [Bacteroidaceae bacterium]|nr:MBL fold metallo-hydrolase [Bacteroidaceae bacterium]